jgi:hypothetical protein
MQRRKLGGLEVSALGLGCMGMTFAYGQADEGESLRTLDRALELGVTFFDTAEVYGPYTNEELLGRAFKGRWDRVQIATKFGFNVRQRPGADGKVSRTDSRPENVREVADASLKRLGCEVIDLFYQHRVDPPSDRGDGRAMAELVQAGKVRHLGLSRRRPRPSGGRTRCTRSRRCSRNGRCGPRTRSGGAADPARAGHRLRALQPARARVPDRRAGPDGAGRRRLSASPCPASRRRRWRPIRPSWTR